MAVTVFELLYYNVLGHIIFFYFLGLLEEKKYTPKNSKQIWLKLSEVWSLSQGKTH